MEIKELESRIDLLDLIGRNHYTKGFGKIHRVIPCPGCGGSDGFTIYPQTNSFHAFCGCYDGGSVFKYLMEVEGMDEEESYSKLLDLAGVSNSNSYLNKKKDPITQPPTKAIEVTEPLQDYTNLIIELYNKQTKKQKEYFLNRGLTNEIIEKHKLSIGDLRGYGEEKAIIPTWKDDKVVFYTGRALRERQDEDKYYKKFDNPTGATNYLFNSNILKQLEAGEMVIITESQIDTLTLEKLGYNSVSLAGSGNSRLLDIAISEIPGADKLEYFTLLDNDSAGNKGRDKLKYKHLRVSSSYNDINEWYLSEGETIKSSIDNQIFSINRPDNLYNYMKNSLISDINAYADFKDRKTGFSNLDEITSLYPGLYVLGGLSTLGKTTFIHQMADQMASVGEHILFFSLEMATLELMTKSISRKTVLNKNGFAFENGVSALDVRLNNIPNEKRASVTNAIDDYKNISTRFNIIEGNFNTNIISIMEYVKNYIEKNKVKPLVIIDYLQIIPGEDSFNKKDSIDKVVTSLKQMSRDYNISVIVVSSLNRSNYLTPIDFESFKESGGIEYTADVIWGLQLQVINDDIFNKQTNIKEKREKINEAKKANPRKIELVCLKNRTGISNYSCNFTYYPKFDLFLSEDYKGNDDKVIKSSTRRL